MVTTYKTPDVYVKEISVFPPSVAEVETAIPAFVGHTELDGGGAFNMKAVRITSLKEYVSNFGGPNADAINLTVVQSADSFTVASLVMTAGNVDLGVDLKKPAQSYLLYHAIKMFYDNGGGACYVVSVGLYNAAITADNLTAGLEVIKLEDEPTLLVVPEAVKLAQETQFGTVAQAMLKQCGDLADRFAILDVYTGDQGVTAANASRADYTGNASVVTGTSALAYGAAYYPFLRTTLNYPIASDEKNVTVTIQGGAATTLDQLLATATLNTALYNFAKAALRNYYMIMPPSPAVAGAYASTDASRGVWKAPANVSLLDVLEPVIKLSNTQQEGLNVDANTGKSINAIRSFVGKGTFIWGARTLLGNDNEWRYVSVRRFFITAEESIKKSTYWAVFEPNDATTWVRVRAMIENYLTQKWREGALAGATPKEAFFVRCGLGSTMTAQDILEGRMNVELGMAVVRPAEFIIIKFSHKLQTS